MKMSYKIRIHNLPNATKLMNYSEGGFFKSEVTCILIPKAASNIADHAIVIVDIVGSYPYITNQWKEYIEE